MSAFNQTLIRTLQYPAINALLSLGMRVFASLIFIVAGFGKVTDYAGTAGYMAMMGVPTVLLPLVILTELGGGLALLVGFQTRLVAFLLAGFSLISGLIFHHNFADQMQFIMFMKNVAMAGGLLAITLHGAGRLSLDNE